MGLFLEKRPVILIQYLLSIVITALHTGMRRGEILSLRWDQVDMQHGFILLDKTKNVERREIPINDSLKVLFHRLPRRIDASTFPTIRRP